MSFCPVYTSQEWINLEKIQGKAIAHILWDKYQGNIPQEYYKKIASEEETIVKNLNKINSIRTESLSDLTSNAFTFIQLSNQKDSALFQSIFRNIVAESELSKLEEELVERFGEPIQSIKFYKKQYPNLNEDSLKLLWMQEKMKSDFINFYSTPLGRESDNKYPKTKEVYERLKSLIEANSFKTQLETVTDKININEDIVKEQAVGETEASLSIDKAFDIDSLNLEGRIKGYTSAMKLTRAKAISDLFRIELLSKIELGYNKISKKTIDQIFNNIFVKYKKRAINLALEAKKLETEGKQNSKEYKEIQNTLSHLAPLIDIGKYNIAKAQELIKADAISILKNQGFKFPKDLELATHQVIGFSLQEVEDIEQQETDMATGGGEVTKGLGDSTNISAFTRVSDKMKMLLGTFKKLDKNGEPIIDEAGDNVYLNMHAIYYFIEQNLIDKYTLDEQIETLNDLVDIVPELENIVNLLTDKDLYSSEEDFERFKNEFKTTFTNQQYKFLAVLTSKQDGVQTVKILNPNRTQLVSLLKQEWFSNVMSKTNDTVGIFDKKWSTRNNEKTKALEKEWENVLTNTEFDYEVSKEFINKILSKMGVELGDTLNTLYSKEFKEENRQTVSSNKVLTHITNMIKALNSENKETKLQKKYNNAINFFAKEKANSELNLYTLSFNDVENKNIFSIQLPSFMSELISNINNNEKRQKLLNDLKRDPLYANSPFLKLLEEKPLYATETFKMFILDGLKKERANKGTKFTKLTSRDFLFSDLALYDNASENSNKEEGIGMFTSKHIFITPAEKKLQTIFEMPKRSVTVDNTGKITKTDQKIVNEGLNIIQGELSRIIQVQQDKFEYDKAEDKNEAAKKLIEHYHHKKGQEGKFNGSAFKIHSFTNLNSFKKGETLLLTRIVKYVLEEGNSVEKAIEEFGPDLVEVIKDFYNSTTEKTLEKLVKEKLISKNETGEYVAKLLPGKFLKVSETEKESTEDTSLKVADLKIRNAVAGYAVNKFINNWELSLLFNGDPAWYKIGDLVKRAYQSNSSISKGNSTGTFKVSVFADTEFSVFDKSNNPTGNNPELYDSLKTAGSILVQKGTLSERDLNKILHKFEKSNPLDAFSAQHPESWKKLLIERGQFTPEIENAYEIAEGIKEGTIEEQNDSIGVLAGLKPFAFGVIWNDDLKKYVPIQYKTFLVPLFKSFIKDNPFLQKKREEMEKEGIDLLVAESTLKGFLPYRQKINETSKISFELPSNILGIQVDNVQHMSNEKNDALRQLKMHVYGLINEDADYNGIKGNELYQELDSLESANIKEATKKVIKKIIDKDGEFLIDLAEGLTARGASEGTKKLFKVENNKFVYPLALTGAQRQVQYMIASVFTKKIAKQEFSGGSAVSVPSLGFTFKDIVQSQSTVTDPALQAIKSSLKWVVKENGQIEIQAAMPPFNDAFFKINKDGKKVLRDISEIPEDLLTFPVYRIPNEGAHSTPVIKIVAFLDPTIGNNMLLPLDIVTLLGEDFDYDKRYFIHKHFFFDEKNNKFVIPKFINGNSKENTQLRYDNYIKKEDKKRIETLKEAIGILNKTQLAKLGAELKSKVLSFEDFSKLSIAEQNTKEARDNRIIEIYKTVLQSDNTFKTMWHPSGFDSFITGKEKYIARLKRLGVSEEDSNDFFTALDQALIKVRNATGLDLKGMAANHVTAHALFTKMKQELNSKKIIRINNNEYKSLHSIVDKNNNYIGDRLGESLAAVLDDLKNPLLELLGINLVTIDTFALLLHAGISFDIAFNLLTNPGIRDTTTKLINNSSNVKESNEGWITLNNINFELQTNINTFRKTILGLKGNLLQVLPKGLIGKDSEFDELKSRIEKYDTPHILSDEIFTDKVKRKDNKGEFENINNWSLERLEKFYYDHKDKIDEMLKLKSEKAFKSFINKHSLLTDVSLLDLEENKLPFNIVTAYTYLLNNFRVNKAFKSYTESAKDLTSRHIKSFVVNKEIGPDIETLFELQTIKGTLNNDKKPVIATGSLDHMDSLYEAVDAQINFLSNELPYLSHYYKQVKDRLIEQQIKIVSDSVSQDERLLFLKKLDRDKVNYFIDLIAKFTNSNLKELKDPKELKNLIERTTKKFEEIRKLSNRKKYGRIAENPFMSLLTKETKKLPYPIIRLRNTKLELTVKNAAEDAILEMYHHPALKDFVIDLAKYSLIFDGAGTGFGGFGHLIDPSIYADLGLSTTYREWQAKNNAAISAYTFADDSDFDHTIDLIVRNNAKSFTKIVDVNVGNRLESEDGSVQFIINSEKVASENRIEENNLKIGTITSAGSQDSEVEWGDEVEAKPTAVYAKYIRVKVKNKEELYVLVSDNMDTIKTYERISFLGGSGYLTEIKNKNDKSDSIIADNNYQVSDNIKDYAPKTEEEIEAERQAYEAAYEAHIAELKAEGYTFDDNISDDLSNYTEDELFLLENGYDQENLEILKEAGVDIAEEARAIREASTKKSSPEETGGQEKCQQ